MRDLWFGCNILAVIYIVVDAHQLWFYRINNAKLKLVVTRRISCFIAALTLFCVGLLFSSASHNLLCDTHNVRAKNERKKQQNERESFYVSMCMPLLFHGLSFFVVVVVFHRQFNTMVACRLDCSGVDFLSLLEGIRSVVWVYWTFTKLKQAHNNERTHSKLASNKKKKENVVRFLLLTLLYCIIRCRTISIINRLN